MGLSSAVGTAGGADMVWSFEFSAMFTFVPIFGIGESLCGEATVGAAHAAFSGRDFSFGYSHGVVSFGLKSGVWEMEFVKCVERVMIERLALDCFWGRCFLGSCFWGRGFLVLVLALVS